jgi:glutamine synthetase
MNKNILQQQNDSLENFIDYYKAGDKVRIISELVKSLLTLGDYKIILGAEIEFYLDGNIDKNLEILMLNIEKNILLNKIIEKELELEKGKNQFEVKFKIVECPIKLADNIVIVKDILKELAINAGLKIDFNAKPYLEEPGSALHIHFNLCDKENNNLFKTIDNKESDLLTYSIGGLCYMMRESMLFFAQKSEDYQRFVPGFDAPTTISWGGNNRTVAIRLPQTGDKRRIEHRVASSGSDPYLTIMAILYGVIFGINNKIIPPPRTYGIAYDEQYQLKTLASNLSDAKSDYDNSVNLAMYIKNLLQKQMA